MLVNSQIELRTSLQPDVKFTHDLFRSENIAAPCTSDREFSLALLNMNAVTKCKSAIAVDTAFL